MRTTPDNITILLPNQIFVFGSNLAGVHGAGAALLAKQKFGAKPGKGFGLSGNSFAIPTKDYKIKTLPIDAIQTFVSLFILWAKAYKKYTFLVTEIGCGLAGYTPEDIAPLFKEAVNIKNIHLPKRFWEVLNKTK